jgi:N-acetyl-anhydromuramyl-L-alanine amidase AmpD
MAYTPPDLPYYGPVAHTSGTGNLPIYRIVIHYTAGNDGYGAQGTARYFRDPDAKGSAHYITDSDESIQCAYDNVVCWHAPPNTHSLGIEMECSGANDAEGHWVLASHIAMMHRTAKLTAQKCLQYGLPVVKLSVADLRAGKRGICGHGDVSLAFGQSTHTDPERFFPWSQFMGWVREEYAALTGPTPTPPEDDMALTQAQEVAIAKAGWLADQFAQGAQFETDIDEIQAEFTPLATKEEVAALSTKLDTVLAKLEALTPKA